MYPLCMMIKASLKVTKTMNTCGQVIKVSLFFSFWNDNRSFNDCVNSARNIIFIRATLWCLKMDLLYVCGLGLQERKTFFKLSA